MVAALQAETVAAEIKTAEMKKACIQMREAVVTQRQRRLVPQDGKKVLLHVAKKKKKFVAARLSRPKRKVAESLHQISLRLTMSRKGRISHSCHF